MKRGAPASSLLLAGRFLKILPASEALAARLLAPVLIPAGLVHIEDTGWWISPDAGSPVPEPRRIACAACALPAGGGISLCLIDVAAEGDEGTIEAVEVDWRGVSSMLAGNVAVFLDARREAPLILAELARLGLPGPRSVRSLVAAVRGAARIPRGSGVEEICRALGAPHREGASPRDAASNVAECVRAAGERRPAAPAPDREDLAGASVLTPSFLAAVPERPGIYRFFDDDGRLLYVGKAANLRRRLRAHAAAASGGARRKGTRALERLARVEIEDAGSDLEALLREARVIRRERPRDNVQREVHERGRIYAPSRRVALVLEAVEPGAVIALFVDGGEYEAAVRLGPRGGGVARAKAILARLFHPRHGTEREGGSGSRESEILRSWLARHGDSVTRVDLDSAPDAAEALARLRGAAESVRRGGEGPALHR